MKGLMNLGNTCYINTAIQCLVAVPDFVNFVMALPRHGDDLLVNSIIELVARLMDDGNATNANEIVIPRRFVGELKQCMSLRVHDPNDIQEFMALFIDKLNSKICGKLSPDVFFGTEFHEQLTTMQKTAKVQWYKSIWNEYSPIKDIFYGLTVGQIRCHSCGKLHHNHEVFSTLILEAPTERTGLEQCLNNYFAEEPVAEGWKCDGCDATSSTSTSSTRVARLCRLPKTLTICIKRFSGMGMRRKNTVIVDAPNELIVDPWAVGVVGRYELRSIACHKGDNHSGHYWSLVKPGQDAPWSKIDDVFVFQTGHHQIETPAEAYVFVYVETN